MGMICKGRVVAWTGVAAALAVSSVVAKAETSRSHEITLDDYFSVNLITEVAASPFLPGTCVFGELRWGDADEPRGTGVWLHELQRVPLTYGRQSGRNIQSSRALGGTVFYLSSDDRQAEKPPYDGSTQVWMFGRALPHSAPITKVAGGVRDYQVLRDGSALFYTRTGKPAKGEWQGMRDKYPDVTFGYGDFKYTELWRLDLESWREELVVAPERVIVDFAVSSDGKQVALITTPDDRLLTNEGWSRVEVHEVDAEQTRIVPDRLFRADGPSPYGWLENVAWRDDGKALAFSVSYDGYPTELYVAQPSADAIDVFRVKRPDEVHVFGHPTWRPNSKSLCFLADQQARVRLMQIDDVDGGRQGAATVLTPGDVVVHDYAFGFSTRNECVFIVKSDTQSTRDIYRVDLDQPDEPWKQMTDANPQMATWKLPQISHITWKSPDGTEVGGILELPPDYEEGDGPLPLVVEIHGGPTAASLLHLRYWIYGRTIFAAKGWALFSPNYRGSTGYGDKFLTELIGHENNRDVADILSGVDALVERGIADPERMAVSGWSNGGFLTNCLITRTQRFKAASSGAGPVSQFMQWGLQDTPGHVINFMQGLPWQRQKEYLAASPGWKLDQVTTATLIHTGMADERIVPANSLTLYRALKDYGKAPVVLLRYPGAGHGLTVSDHRRAKLEWDIKWFEKYVLGENEE
jgi:dipeptidyl aminopeptidase/acylaminoacyl peptidase